MNEFGANMTYNYEMRSILEGPKPMSNTENWRNWGIGRKMLQAG